MPNIENVSLRVWKDGHLLCDISYNSLKAVVFNHFQRVIIGKQKNKLSDNQSIPSNTSVKLIVQPSKALTGTAVSCSS